VTISTTSTASIKEIIDEKEVYPNSRATFLALSVEGS